MTARISRRTLVVGGLCGVGLSAGLIEFAERQMNVRGYVQAIIYRNIPGIIFDGADLDQLVEDLARAPGPNILSYEWFKDVVGKTVDSEFVDSIQNERVRRMTTAYQHPILNAFFMATDFFPEGYREGRQISFVRSSDPYVAKCCNPLAIFDNV